MLAAEPSGIGTPGMQKPAPATAGRTHLGEVDVSKPGAAPRLKRATNL